MHRERDLHEAMVHLLPGKKPRTNAAADREIPCSGEALTQTPGLPAFAYELVAKEAGQNINAARKELFRKPGLDPFAMSRSPNEIASTRTRR